MSSSDFFSIFLTIAPKLLLIGAIIWSLFSSPFAWWVSQFPAKGRLSRVGYVLLIWLIIVIVRVKLFVALLLKGVSLTKQIHAWGMFVRLVKCFVKSKTDTLVMGIISIVLSCDPKVNLDENKELDCESIVNDDSFIEGISSSGGELIKLMFCLTKGDQEYLDALLALFKKAKDDGILHIVYNFLLEALHKYDFSKIQKHFCMACIDISKMVMKFACKMNDVDLAERVVRLRQLIAVLSRSNVKHVGEKEITRIVDEFIECANAVIAKLYVIARMHTERVRCSSAKSHPESDNSVYGEKAPCLKK